LEKEKIITKAICSVLSGFEFDGFPDAVESALADAAQQQQDKDAK